MEVADSPFIKGAVEAIRKAQEQGLVLFFGDAEENRFAAEVNGVDFCYITGEVKL